MSDPNETPALLLAMTSEEFDTAPSLPAAEIRTALKKGQDDLMKVVAAQRPVRQDPRLRFR